MEIQYYIPCGTYYECIRINKSISLIGENKNCTIIDGNKASDVTVRILVDKVNISEFTIQNSGNGYSGLCTYANCTNISNNIVKSNGNHGILVRYWNNHIISKNIILDNNQNGIYLEDSWNNTISSNNAILNGNFGIWLESSHSNIISYNNLSSNGNEGIYVYYSTNNNILNNTILSNEGVGVSLKFSSNNNTVSGNILSNNNLGVYIRESTNIDVSGNIISYNNHDGIRLIWSSHNNNFSENNIISNNNYGINISSYYGCSNNNNIYHNNIINNTVNAVDDCGNIWNKTYPYCGNHWGDYLWNDSYSGPNQDIPGPDGIGDIPYEIPCEHGTDYYPLMHPFELYYILNISTPLTVDEGTEFNVVVTSMGGPVVPNATVEFNDELKLTDSDGRVYFTAPQVEYNTLYNITATKKNYTSDTERILVKDIPDEFERALIIGLIKNLTVGDEITFNARLVLVIKFSPLKINLYKTGELITIEKDYFGLVGARFIFALCDVYVG
jgi:parallel beta-helix repeat protein